ncbi:glucose-6-phosphate dehydrogenase [Thermithiobacillus tepidarius DSM 3134]|uniref:glucose-6-phosphate dehydrogenase n=1 Tax=Thermithiobacillus tepidarius TaxID=929 RepID=UPI000408578C|nr:glucose-6-phosphate dehydrogenase [Thermithiobacillus tepidarius]
MIEGACHFVVFGATGNLASNKLLPALYHLEQAERLPDDLTFFAFARRDWNNDAWNAHMREVLEKKIRHFDEGVFTRFAARFSYIRGDLNDPDSYRTLAYQLGQTEVTKPSNTIFYLAIKPTEFSEVIRNLGAVGLSKEKGNHRIVIEKPFGDDLESALLLNERLHQYFNEDQIYRIDHYMGKETVQNLVVFRFANLMIEPLWNRNFIDHVQITVAEEIGIEGRADYYDKAGALRDMLQNHLMQLLTLVAMEPPPALEADAIRDEKVKVLRSIRPISRRAIHAHAFRAQYGPGYIHGVPVPGYQDEPGVERHSVTETYVSAKLYIDNWRWRGVPFYLRTGKRMAKQVSGIALRFRHPPQQLFRETPIEDIDPNWILLSIQPTETIKAELQVRLPGLEMRTRTAQLNASYRASDEAPLDAYEALLLDVIEGDRTLFIRFDEVEWAWRVVDPILKYWAQERDFIHSYPAGTWGSDESCRLFDSEDQTWRNEF